MTLNKVLFLHKHTKGSSFTSVPSSASLLKVRIRNLVMITHTHKKPCYTDLQVHLETSRTLCSVPRAWTSFEKCGNVRQQQSSHPQLCFSVIFSMYAGAVCHHVFKSGVAAESLLSDSRHVHCAHNMQIICILHNAALT